MERKRKISQYRERLDKTLASHNLTNEATLKTLVKNQILRSSQCEIEDYIDNVVEKRTKEVSNFLEMLKSASVNDDEGLKTKETPHGGWKLKQDTEEYRVMYREGPEGTPFYSLLVEGFIDGPVDVCLCISWESNLYKKWWPQSSIPTFKVISSECLQKVRIGEQISLVRMKISWPLSAREAVVNFFEFEYFQEDLIIVLLNSISDLESINRSTHGFTKEGIPDAQDVVRIDVVGGFALQKVTPDRSYFRAITNLDIKLDFAPPSIINFISRQLIGSGFRLYQKEVASVYKGDEDFGKALKDPLCTRIREALYSDYKQKGALEPEGLNSDACILAEEHPNETMQSEQEDIIKKVPSDDRAIESLPKDRVVTDHTALGEIEEIEEEEIEESRHLQENGNEIHSPPTNQIAENCCVYDKRIGVISPKVEQALETLDKIISIFRENIFNPETRSLPSFINEEFLNLEKSVVKDSESSEDGQSCLNGGFCAGVTKNETVERISYEPKNSSGSCGSRRMGSNSYLREANHNRVAPASSEEQLPNLIPSETHRIALCSSENETTEAPTLDKTINGGKMVNADANDIYENSPNKGKNKKLRFCCLHFTSGQLRA
uniref:START domain-containing protein n=1 Tax=Davidia involucrata TaxID=16924 RepID=A0A5B6ZA46_DAVIN